MMDPLKEQLSAFLDGELPETETELFLKRLERDAELGATLSRYSLIGAALRGDAGTASARPVAARVSAAIAREPALTGTGGRRDWRRPAAGFAVAASVALAAVLLAGLPGRNADGIAPATVAAVVPAVEAVPAAVPSAGQLAAADVPSAATLPAGYTTPRPAAGTIPPAELANFLVAHSEHASFVGRGAVLNSLLTVERPAAAPPAEPAR